MTDKLREEIINIIAADESLKFRTEAIEAVIRRERMTAAREALKDSILHIERQWP